jgi:hypothetical protein
MALINCSECGREVSTSAAACPHCGAPVKAATPPAIPPPPPPAVPAPPPATPPTPSQPKSKALRNLLIAGGCLIPIVICAFLLIWSAVSYFGRNSQTQSAPPPSRLQAALTAALQSELSDNKQKLYEKIHVAGAFGLGKAKSDVIQRVTLNWKGGRVTDVASDLLSFTVEHTLYWNTLVTDDGHTQLRDTYDCSSGTPRLVDSKVLATNGDTIEGVTNALIEYTAKEIQNDLKNAINDASKTSPSPSR